MLASRVPAANGRRRGQRSIVEVDLPLGEPLEDHLQRDATLEACQSRTEAVVRADAKGHMLMRLAMDVKNIAVGGN